MDNSTQSNKPTTLIVEDDRILAEIFAYAFQLSGFQVKTCHDGIEAKEYLIKSRPDVILLDLHLPKLSGEDLVSFIHNEYATPDIIMILATGDSRRASFLQNRVDYVFLKPISYSQIKQIGLRIFKETQMKSDNAIPMHPPFVAKSDTGPITPNQTG